MKWTIFGAGNLIYDIIDAIHSNNQQIGEIVLNQLVNVDLQDFYTLSIEDYKAKPSRERYNIFGFNNPDKEKLLKELDIEFSNLFHITNWKCKGTVGIGNFFGAHSTIASLAAIGNFNCFNRNSSVGHHTKIGNFNHIAPGATICGKCIIGDKNDIGAGAVVIDNVEIGNNVIIGAGAVVVKNITEPGVYVGIPAKLISTK